MNRMKNRCKNITLPQTSFACGNNLGKPLLANHTLVLLAADVGSPPVVGIHHRSGDQSPAITSPAGTQSDHQRGQVSPGKHYPIRSAARTSFPGVSSGGFWGGTCPPLYRVFIISIQVLETFC